MQTLTTTNNNYHSKRKTIEKQATQDKEDNNDLTQQLKEQLEKEIKQTQEDKTELQTNSYEKTENTKKEENKEETVKVEAPKENKYLTALSQVRGTGKGNLLDENFNEVSQVKVENLFNEIKSSNKNIKTVVFDGIISQRLVDLAKEKNIEYLVAVKMSEVVKKPETIKIITN